MKNEKQETYLNILLDINKSYFILYKEDIIIKYLHCDFEPAIKNAAKRVYTNVEIKNRYYNFTNTIF